MEENYQDYLFIPKCFEKECKKIFKSIKQNRNNPKSKLVSCAKCSNLIYEVEKTNSYEYISSLFSELSPGLILEKLKDVDHLKLWFQLVGEFNSMLKISQYCDIVEMKFDLPIFKYFNYFNNYKIIRYWSYNQEEHSYFLIFKPLDNNLSKIIKLGGFVINFDQSLQRHYSEPGCILTFYIKLRKSKYTTLIDRLYKFRCREFCGSLENFIGSIKMHKYNLIMNETLNNTFGCDDSDSLECHKYLIHSLTSMKFEEQVKNNFFLNNEKSYFQHNTQLQDLDSIKTFYEVQNYVKNNFESEAITDNEIKRFIKARGSYDKVVSSLKSLIHFKNYIKTFDLNTSFLNSFNFEFNKFISFLCRDNLSRPVILVKMKYLEVLSNNELSSHDSTRNLIDTIIKYIIQTFENCAELMSSDVDKYFVIIDLGGFNQINNFDFNTNLKRVFKLFEEFYVERLGLLVVINKGNNSNFLKQTFSLLENKILTNKIKISNNHVDDLKELISKENLKLLE